MEKTPEGVDEEERRAWVNGNVPAAVGTSAAVVAASLGADPATAAGAGLIANRGAALAWPAVRRRMEAVMDSIRRPWAGVADPEKEFWRRVREREAAQEVWYVATDRLRGLLDPAACGALGALVREYVERDRMPDALFRDISGLFCDLNGEELAELKRLFVHVNTLEVNTARVRLEVHTSAPAGLHLRFYKIGDDEAVRSFSSLLGSRFACTDATLRVFRLLAKHGVADGGDESSSGLIYIHIRRDLIARLLGLVEQ